MTTRRTCTERDARRWARHRMTWAVAGTATCLTMAALLATLIARADDALLTTGLALHSAVALAGALACLLVVGANAAVVADARDARATARLALVPPVMAVAWVLALVAAAVSSDLRPTTMAMVAASAPMAWIPAVLARTTRRAPRPAELESGA